MDATNSFFECRFDEGDEASKVRDMFVASMTLKCDEIARATVESMRGTSHAKAIGPPQKIYALSFRCSSCNGLTHSDDGRAPIFCQWCGKMFDYDHEEEHDD